MSISLVLAIVFYLYFGILFFAMNGVAFSGFFFVLGTICLVYHFTRKKIKEHRWLYMFIKVCAAVAIIIFIAVEGMIIAFPKKSTENCDYIIVLGARVIGNEPGLTLKGRLDRAVEYVKNNDDDCKIVVSGGKGDGENISEAEAMKRYLVERGIKPEMIIKEDKSVNTMQNFEFSRDKIENDSKKNVADVDVKVVTTDFHAFRSNKYAKMDGYKNISFYTERTKWYLIPVFYVREFFAIIKMMLVSIYTIFI